jgi:hypothetical protein
MKTIPWWVWALAVGGGLYLWSKSSNAVTTGSQIYIPAGTPLYSDSGLTTSAGTTSIGSIFTAGTITGNATQITLGTTPYWVNSSAATAATAAQLSASNAGTLS